MFFTMDSKTESGDESHSTKLDQVLAGGSMRNYKALHVGKYYAPYKGGIETYLELLAKDLCSRLDVEVVVANHARGAQRDVCEVREGVPVRRLRTPFTVAGAPICPGLVRRLRATEADIIHVHLPNPTAVLAYLAAGNPAKLVVSYHSDTVRQKILGGIFEPFQQAFLKRAQAIIVASPSYLSSSGPLSKHANRCHVIPYGIDTASRLHCDETRVQELRSYYGPRLVLAVGRHVYYKGFEHLLRAIALVERSTLLLIGDGPLRPALERLA